MNDDERERLERIEYENDTRIFPESDKRWLCDLVKRLDAQLSLYQMHIVEQLREE